MNKVMHSKFYFFRPSSKAPFQFKHYFSLIKDPLWKRVCADAVNLMGPMALQISQVQLGAFSSKDQVADMFTKGLNGPMFKYLKDKLGMGIMSSGGSVYLSVHSKTLMKDIRHPITEDKYSE